MKGENKLLQLTKKLLNEQYGINDKIFNIIMDAEKDVKNQFENIDEIREYNQFKVLQAFRNNHISDAHFHNTTGYGYDDLGRDALDRVFAEIFNAEDALVRANIISGTHALSLALYGVLRPGDTLLAVTGKPYDTLDDVIGISDKANDAGSLKDLGVNYKQVDLKDGLEVDFDALKLALTPDVKVAMIQKSKGYAWRSSLSTENIKEIISFIKSINKDIICFVDNCYGEFIEPLEPTSVGADLVAGSLIKNAGGGIAPTGGYIAGKSKYIEKVAYRLTVPGIGKEAGCNLGVIRLLYQGLFFAPHVSAESVKGAILTARVFEKLGFEVCPASSDKRMDIIQSIKFNDPEKLIAFCQGIQSGSPVDSHVEPQPWDMPGYNDQVIMAAGTFVQGASIELSADAPIRPPYIAYLQGGLNYDHVKIGLMIALQKMVDRRILNV